MGPTPSSFIDFCLPLCTSIIQRGSSVFGTGIQSYITGISSNEHNQFCHKGSDTSVSVDPTCAMVRDTVERN